MLRIPEDCPKERLDRLVARFQREMRLCARLHHPNIVRLMDSGRADDRGVYAVFEFVPGKNLATVLATERRLHPVEARHLMIQILDALACAHASGVVHRDLKPANMMVVPTGARRNAVVLDFGIGTLIEDARPDEAQITHSNEWIGSPAYAAPEQLRGQRSSPRSDLYAWGLVFLECLTGERVVRGATMADTVWKQLSPEPIPIPERIAAHPLGHILKRVTQKDARARPQRRGAPARARGVRRERARPRRRLVRRPLSLDLRAHDDARKKPKRGLSGGGAFGGERALHHGPFVRRGRETADLGRKAGRGRETADHGRVLRALDGERKAGGHRRRRD